MRARNSIPEVSPFVHWLDRRKNASPCRALLDRAPYPTIQHTQITKAMYANGSVHDRKVLCLMIRRRAGRVPRKASDDKITARIRKNFCESVMAGSANEPLQRGANSPEDADGP